jgi:DNA polymerase III gamma/tau subunit
MKHTASRLPHAILLKPVEEPPQHVYWVFCTTDAGKIPRTISTRCLRYELKPVKDEIIYELLSGICETERLQVSDDILEAIAENAQGSPRQSLVYLESCAHAKTPAEANAAMRAVGQSGEVINLCRWLIAGRAHSWAEAAKHVTALDGVDAEGCRIAIVNYLSAVLLNTKSNDKAKQLLGLLEPFLTTYNTSDKLAPLLQSLGLALNLDQ